jgi:hypothetical protein
VLPRSLLTLVALTLAPALTPAVAAAQSNPWESTFGRKPKIWTDPDGRFSLDLPQGWTPQVGKDSSPNPVVITRSQPDSGLQAVLTVEMRPVPPGTRLTHFAQRVEEEVRSVARQYRLIDQDKVEISGTTARRVLFSYQQQAHAEMLAEVAQVVFILGERAFVVTLETGYGARAAFWEDFEIMSKSFSGAAPGEETRAVRPGDTRKPIGPGQMVNPDVARY